MEQVGKYRLKVEVVRSRMKRLGISNAQIIAACEVNVRTLQRWFAGQLVNGADAERLAHELRLGTGEVFAGVSERSAWQRLALLQRFLSARDTALAQSLRISAELARSQPNTVFFDAHPVHGYLVQHEITQAMQHGFMPFVIRPRTERLHVQVRVRLARRLAYATANLYLDRERAYLVEVWSSNAMRATPRPDGPITLWTWLGAEAQQLLFVGDADFDVDRVAETPRDELNLDAPELQHAVVLCPGQMHLRMARLPIGFDRLHGTREDRLGIKLYEVPGGVSETPPDNDDAPVRERAG